MQHKEKIVKSEKRYGTVKTQIMKEPSLASVFLAIFQPIHINSMQTNESWIKVPSNIQVSLGLTDRYDQHLLIKAS